MAKLSPGTEAPDFTLPTDDGGSFRLSAAKGAPVVVYFYPEDDSGGCTTENVEFDQLLPEFAALGAKVVGISPDTVERHRKFKAKYGLRVALASDPEREAIERYGLWGPKKMFGRPYIGLIRTTFLVDSEGKIADLWTVTRIKGHAATVLESLRALNSP